MVTFKTLKEKHLPFLLEIRNDESTRKFLEVDKTFTLEECKKWYKGLKEPYLLILNKNKEKVGYFRVIGDQIGVDIHPNHRRKGYAKSAYKEYLKDKKFASLWVFEDNFALELYKKLGFTHTGEVREERGRSVIRMEWTS